MTDDRGVVDLSGVFYFTKEKKMKRLITRISMTVVALLMVGLMVAPAQAEVLWYNGDFDGLNGLANEINSQVSQANVYDDFVVSGGNWLVDAVWSNNIMSFTGVSQALWEIRSGVSSGNGGTLIASGTDTATQTATGNSGFGYDEYMIKVSGLNVSLAPGTYWLTVAPIGAGSGRSFNTTTNGLFAVGEPSGDNDNSFFNSSYFGNNFTQNYLEQGKSNFSMGIEGSTENSPIPEPGSLMLLGTGLLGLLGLRKKNR